VETPQGCWAAVGQFTAQQSTEALELPRRFPRLGSCGVSWVMGIVWVTPCSPLHWPGSPQMMAIGLGDCAKTCIFVIWVIVVYPRIKSQVEKEHEDKSMDWW